MCDRLFSITIVRREAVNGKMVWKEKRLYSLEVEDDSMKEGRDGEDTEGDSWRAAEQTDTQVWKHHIQMNYFSCKLQNINLKTSQTRQHMSVIPAVGRYKQEDSNSKSASATPRFQDTSLKYKILSFKLCKIRKGRDKPKAMRLQMTHNPGLTRPPITPRTWAIK